MPILALLGFSALFILSMAVYNGEVEYKVGEIINSTTYFNASGNLSVISETVVDVYATFPAEEEEGQAHFFGVMFMIFFAIAFALVIAFEIGKGDTY